MIELHPEIVEKDGKKQFVILPYEEFLAIEEALADAEDLAALRTAKRKEHSSPSVTLQEAVDDLELPGLTNSLNKHTRDKRKSWGKPPFPTCELILVESSHEAIR